MVGRFPPDLGFGQLLSRIPTHNLPESDSRQLSCTDRPATTAPCRGSSDGGIRRGEGFLPPFAGVVTGNVRRVPTASDAPAALPLLERAVEGTLMGQPLTGLR